MTGNKKTHETRAFDADADKLNFEFDYNLAETEALGDLLNHNPNPTLDDLRRVALWKIDRILDIPEGTIRNLSKLVQTNPLSHRSQESRDILQELTDCPGVWYPMASAILKFLRPDIFPIIDVRAYRALKGKRLYPRSYSVDLYLDYVDELKDIASKTNIPFHEVDQQLYCFDREFNQAINS
ncbi:MAG: hypothetical protein JAY90_11525 [Candidatus Thiodiazotropha lotti]|nr:hypothetical protein [Candidatus Thiodiazotropha lotti]